MAVDLIQLARSTGRDIYPAIRAMCLPAARSSSAAPKGDRPPHEQSQERFAASWPPLERPKRRAEDRGISNSPAPRAII